MKERPASDRSWMWQPPLPGDGANSIREGLLPAVVQRLSRRTGSPV